MISNLGKPGRARLIGISLLMATFLAGGFSGAALERHSRVEPVNEESSTDSSTQKGDTPELGKRRSIFDRLDLEPAQRVTIDSILQVGRERVDAYWKEWEPGYRALLDSTRIQVREVLTPEQREKYDEIRARRRARIRANQGKAEGKSNASGGVSINRGGRRGVIGGFGLDRGVQTMDWQVGAREARTE